MKEYEEHYASYKQSILQSHRFRLNYKDRYDAVIYAERGYIDKSSIFFKISGLSILGTIFLVLFALFDATTFWTALLKFVFFAGLVTCLVVGALICDKFKKETAIANFYSYESNRLIMEQVSSDKDEEVNNLLSEMQRSIRSVQIYAQSINDAKNLSPDERKRLQDSLIAMLLKMNDYSDDIEIISRYERIARNLTEDYYFSKALHEVVHGNANVNSITPNQ